MKNLKMKKTYYVGVRKCDNNGYYYCIYSQTNQLKKAIEDKYYSQIVAGGTGVILSKGNDEKLYELCYVGCYDNLEDDYEIDYDCPVNKLFTLFKKTFYYIFNGKNYIEC